MKIEPDKGGGKSGVRCLPLPMPCPHTTTLEKSPAGAHDKCVFVAGGWLWEELRTLYHTEVCVLQSEVGREPKHQTSSRCI